MSLKPSGEMYLETVYVLIKENQNVRSVDIAEHMSYSKPSVSRAVGKLKEEKYITVDKDGYITLTDKGMSVAKNIYERHTILSSLLLMLGVSDQVAAEDACRIEHVISEETFEALKKYIEDKK